MKAERVFGLLIRQSPMILAIFLTGCFLVAPPVRVPTSIKTPSGQKAALAPETPVPGQTTRQEVEEKFRAFESDSGVPNLFWGRYVESKWTSVILTGTETDRIWTTRNILATFDEKGYVKTFEIIGNDRLLKRLASLQKELKLPPLDLSKPVGLACSWKSEPEEQMSIELSEAGVILKNSSSKWVETKPRWPETISIPAAQVIGMEAIDGELVPRSELAFRFSKKTAVGKSFEFYAAQRDVLAIVSWFAQVKNGSQSQSRTRLSALNQSGMP